MHKILDIDLDKLRAWITDKRTDDEVRETFHEKNRRYFFRGLFMCRQWLADEHLDALFLFIRFKIKAVGIPSAQNFTTADTIFMVWNRHRILVAKWPLYNVHTNHWVILCLDLVSCQVRVWDSLLSLTTAEEMRNILLPIRELVPNLLDSTGFFARRGRSSTYKEP
ncbi:hypothetical protein IC582_011112 [Cucumis melo]